VNDEETFNDAGRLRACVEYVDDVHGESASGSGDEAAA
jgi:hypothetical protein